MISGAAFFWWFGCCLSGFLWAFGCRLLVSVQKPFLLIFSSLQESSEWSVPTSFWSFLAFFGTEASVAGSLVHKSSKNLRALIHLPWNHALWGTRNYTNKASVPNMLLPGLQINQDKQFSAVSVDDIFLKMSFCTENESTIICCMHRLVRDARRRVMDLVLTFTRHLFDNDSILPVSVGDRRLNSGSLDLWEPGILAKLLNLAGSFCSFPRIAGQSGSELIIEWEIYWSIWDSPRAWARRNKCRLSCKG